MTIIRAPREDRYTILNRTVISDDRLSFRALGLLTFILDKPDDWRIDSTELARGEGREGRDAVRAALTELEAAGYLRRQRVRRADGTFDMESTVYDTPVEEPTGAGKPGPGNPAPVDQATKTSTDTEYWNDSDAPLVESAPHSPPPTRRATPLKAAMPRAERDEVYQAAVVACGWTYGEMTQRQRKSCAVAVNELLAVGATPEEVHRRALIYPQRYQAALTPNALASQWAALREVPTAGRDNSALAALRAYAADDTLRAVQ